MAIYHLAASVITRSQGKSAVAAAAYRAGERLKNPYTGMEHDYRNKGWVTEKIILLPPEAPTSYYNRQELWSAVEMSEKSKDARLAREILVAIPKELDDADGRDLVIEYVKSNFVTQGMCADITFHNPPKMDDLHRPIDITGKPTRDIRNMIFQNPHAHILLTIRPIDSSGAWEQKTQKLYKCRRGQEEKNFTAEEFCTEKDKGWEKIYKYRQGKKTLWLTQSEAMGKDLERVSRSPRSEKYGRPNPKYLYWNSDDRIKEWRKAWEDLANTKLREIGAEARIDCRSYISQGRVDEIPTLHKGPAATQIEKRTVRKCIEGNGAKTIIRSFVEEQNERIRDENHQIQNLKFDKDCLIIETGIQCFLKIYLHLLVSFIFFNILFHFYPFYILFICWIPDIFRIICIKNRKLSIFLLQY